MRQPCNTSSTGCAGRSWVARPAASRRALRAHSSTAAVDTAAAAATPCEALPQQQERADTPATTSTSTRAGSQPWQAALLAAMQQHHAAAHEEQAPAAASCVQDVEPLLDACYNAIDEVFFSKGGFVIPPRERKLIDATGGSASYGEVEAAGVRQLLRYLAMDGSSVFVDLGCGRGRAVLHAAALAPLGARCLGLELSASRLEQADMALAQLQAWGVALAPVQFRAADLSACSLEEGSHFYLCSTAFGAGICRSIAQRLAASPNFRVLLTSRQLPTQPFLYKLGEVPCAYTFNPHGRAYVYVKSLQQAPPQLLARLWCAEGVCWLPSMRGLQLGIAADQPLAAPGGDASRFVRLQHPVLAALGPAGAGSARSTASSERGGGSSRSASSTGMAAGDAEQHLERQAGSEEEGA